MDRDGALAGAGILALPLVVFHPPLALLLGLTAAIGGAVGLGVHGQGRRSPYGIAATAGALSLALLVVMAVFLLGMSTDSGTGVVESVSPPR